MKNKLYITLLAVCAAGLSSCHSDIDNFMVDDTIGFLNSGLVEVTVYKGVEDPLNFYAIKAGKGFQHAEVSLAVDDQVLADYNATAAVTMSAVPSDCYTISISSLSFTTDDYRKAFQITWDRTALEAALEADPNIVIPVSMIVAETGVQVDESRLTALIKPSMETPTISFEEFGFTTGLTPTRRSATEEDVYKVINANFIAQNDIDIELAFDATLIDEYNEAHGTSYKVLPEDAFRIETYNWTLKKYLNSVRYKFTFVREALIPENGSSKFGSYMIPLRIVSAKTGNISYRIEEGKDFMLYTVDVIAAEIDKGKWTIVSTSADADIANDPDKATSEGDYGPANLIDGTTSKSWRTVWTTSSVTYPMEIVIDLGVERDLYRMGFDNPTGSNRRYANNMSGHFEASNDGENFTNIGTWAASSKTVATVVTDVTPTTARYVKFVIDEVWTPGARTSIAEINMWGE